MEILKNVMRINANRYKYGAVSPEDLMQEQEIKLSALGVTENSTEQEKRTASVALRNRCLQIRRGEVRRVLNEIRAFQEYFSLYSDGSRRLTEEIERLHETEVFGYFTPREKQIAEEFLSPSRRTRSASRLYRIQIMQERRAGVCRRNRPDFKTRCGFVAQGLRLNVADVVSDAQSIKTKIFKYGAVDKCRFHN